MAKRPSDGRVKMETVKNPDGTIFAYRIRYLAEGIWWYGEQSENRLFILRTKRRLWSCIDEAVADDRKERDGKAS